VGLVVFLREQEIPRLAEIFPSPEFYVPPAEVIAAEVLRPAKGQFNVIHMARDSKRTFTRRAGTS